MSLDNVENRRKKHKKEAPEVFNFIIALVVIMFILFFIVPLLFFRGMNGAIPESKQPVSILNGERWDVLSNTAY